MKMKVTEKDVCYVADLANLALSAEERTGMVRDLNSILDYVSSFGAEVWNFFQREVQHARNRRGPAISTLEVEYRLFVL